jgi:hypothetical protein
MKTDVALLYPAIPVRRLAERPARYLPEYSALQPDRHRDAVA